jgi:hypothetical protein
MTYKEEEEGGRDVGMNDERRMEVGMRDEGGWIGIGYQQEGRKFLA